MRQRTGQGHVRLSHELLCSLYFCVQILILVGPLRIASLTELWGRQRKSRSPGGSSFQEPSLVLALAKLPNLDREKPKQEDWGGLPLLCPSAFSPMICLATLSPQSVFEAQPV